MTRSRDLYYNSWKQYWEAISDPNNYAQDVYTPNPDEIAERCRVCRILRRLEAPGWIWDAVLMTERIDVLLVQKLFKKFGPIKASIMIKRLTDG